MLTLPAAGRNLQRPVPGGAQLLHRAHPERDQGTDGGNVFEGFLNTKIAYRLDSASTQNAQTLKSVILSGALAESKNLRIDQTFAVKSVRRSFDSLQKSAIFCGRSG